MKFRRWIYEKALATSFLGADNEIELMRKYDQIIDLLAIQIEYMQE